MFVVQLVRRHVSRALKRAVMVGNVGALQMLRWYSVPNDLHVSGLAWRTWERSILCQSVVRHIFLLLTCNSFVLRFTGTHMDG